MMSGWSNGRIYKMREKDDLEHKKKPVMAQEDIMKLLDSCYEKCVNGIPKVSLNVEELADDY